mmetsp:Transcript_17068/g.20842  ORF Transcript_17068/g.20842 Transcript_17068/m.20842 type:complete len:548 (+) Transcript_17068:64-1707(+)
MKLKKRSKNQAAETLPHGGGGLSNHFSKQKNKNGPPTIRLSKTFVFLFAIMAMVVLFTLNEHVFRLNTNQLSFSKQVYSDISYKVIRFRKFNNTMDFYGCKPEEETKKEKGNIRTSNSMSILNESGVADFNIQLTTSLKILLMGDSVGVQYTQALQQAAEVLPHNRIVQKYSWGEHEGISLALPVKGGGAIAGYRITGLFQAAEQDVEHHQAPHRGGGWMKEHVEQLMKYIQHQNVDGNLTAVHEKMTNSETIAKTDMEASSSSLMPSNAAFDVLIHQFPASWIDVPWSPKFTQEAIGEAVNLANLQFGAKIVILQTVPIQNNLESMDELVKINQAIWDFATQYKPSPSGDGVQVVVVMDVGAFSTSLFVYNSVGMNMTLPNESMKYLDAFNDDDAATETTTAENFDVGKGLRNMIWDYSNRTFRKFVLTLESMLSQRLLCCHREWDRQMIGYCCDEKVEHLEKKCTRNKFSRDGMHFCMDVVAGRIVGATSCLLKCSVDIYDVNESKFKNENYNKALRSCEKKCNRQYMSLKPIPFIEGMNTIVNY